MSDYFQRLRYEWIKETVEIFGFINRDHLRRKFGVSYQQASTDLAEAQKLWPDLMTYNPSTKRYERT